MFHKHAVPPPFLPLPLCAPRIRSFVACPPGGILPRPTKRRKYTCLSSCARATVSGGPGERGESAAMISATAFALSPSLGLNYENGIVTFHSPSRSPSAERGEERKTSGGRAAPGEDGRKSCFQRLITLSPASTPRRAHCNRITAQVTVSTFFALSPLEFIALSKRMRIGKHNRTRQYLNRGKTTPT